MSPHYDCTPERVAATGHSVSAPLSVSNSIGSGPDEDAMEEAAEALRQAEVEAVLPDLDALEPSQLEHMSIDELRAVAKALDVPGRAQITEQDELIEAIRRCL
jgi:hypothetical protein